MRVAVDPEITVAPPPGKLSRIEMRIAAALGEQPGAGQPLNLGQNLQFLVAVDQ